MEADPSLERQIQNCALVFRAKEIMLPLKEASMLLLLVHTMCLPSATPAPAQQTDTHAFAEPDTLLFSTLVQYVNENGLWIGPTDARAFDLRDVEAERPVLSMAPDAVHPVADERRAERRQALRRLGVRVTDIVADAACAFTSGLPVPDSTGALTPASPACQEKGSFVSVAFGSPRPADACSGTETQLDSEDMHQCVVVRAVEISDHSFYEYDLTVAYTADQGWTVVKKTVIDGVAS